MDRIALILASFLTFSGFAQEEFKRDMYLGNLRYDKKQYTEALDYFQTIVDSSPLHYKANFNKGNTLFRMEKYAEASEIFVSITELAPTRRDRSKVYHNLGNAFLLNKQLDDAIEAYKEGLRLNPGDEETRYNLAFAQKLKKEQEKNQQQPQQQQNNDGGDDPENGDENGDKKNQESDQNKDENQNEKKQNDGQEEQNKDGDPKNQDKEENAGNPQKNPVNISRDEARRILENAYRNEKNLKEKLEKKKLVANGKSQKKDW